MSHWTGVHGNITIAFLFNGEQKQHSFTKLKSLIRKLLGKKLNYQADIYDINKRDNQGNPRYTPTGREGGIDYKLLKLAQTDKRIDAILVVSGALRDWDSDNVSILNWLKNLSKYNDVVSERSWCLLPHGVVKISNSVMRKDTWYLLEDGKIEQLAQIGK